MDISAVDPETLMKLYSIVFQDVTLFNNTIMENIRLGRKDATDEEVLTDSLRQMIDDGLAYRYDYRELPPRVEYGLTELGREMLPIIDALADFGNYYKSVLDGRTTGE